MPLQIQIIDGPINGIPVYVESAMGSPAQYDSGAIASGEVELRRRILPEDSSIRYRIVKIESENDSDNWKIRESRRFDTGFYQAVPWATESWFMDSPHYDSHYCHMSRDKTAMVAFTESDSKGRDDKQKRMRAGRYLTQYFKIDDIEVRHWAGKVSILVGESDSVLFATTPDDIEEVYTSGPHSCMAHEANHYAGSCHPTRVYGAGDLAIAYLDRESSIAARCISWPEKKIYGRVYGDGGVWSEQLKTLLQDSGFRYSSNSSDWNGARLLRIEENNDSFVIPYFDIPGSATDCGDYLRVKPYGDIPADNESGVSCGGGRLCDHCETRYNDEDSGGYIESSEQNLCDDCYCELSFHCEDCETTGLAEDAQHITRIGRYVCESCASDYSTCDSCNEWDKSDNMTYVDTLDKTYCESCFENKCTFCGECGEADSSDKFVTGIDNDSICESCAESKVECIECHKYDESEECFVDSDGDSWCSDCRQSCLEFSEQESI